MAIATRLALAAGASAAPIVPPALLAKAAAAGSVRVLAQLRVEPNADADEIDRVKQAVLAEIAGTPHRVTRMLDRLPTLALDASAETLRALAASQHVRAVREDAPRRPLE